MSAEVMALLNTVNAKLDRLLAMNGPRRPSDDEKIFKDPKEKYWNGPSYIGSKLSEAPADYLRAYAKYKSACAYMGRKENDPSKLQYAERDEKTVKLAHAWADYRDASGDVPAPAAESVASASDDSDLPF